MRTVEWALLIVLGAASVAAQVVNDPPPFNTGDFTFGEGLPPHETGAAAIRYGPGRHRHILVWPRADPSPLAVIVSDPGWFVARGPGGAEYDVSALQHAGFAVAQIDLEEQPPDATLADLRTALATLSARAETLKLDPARLVLLGRGAGGYLALRLGCTLPARAVAALEVEPIDIASRAARSERSRRQVIENFGLWPGDWATHDIAPICARPGAPPQYLSYEWRSPDAEAVRRYGERLAAAGVAVVVQPLSTPPAELRRNPQAPQPPLADWLAGFAR